MKTTEDLLIALMQEISDLRQKITKLEAFLDIDAIRPPGSKILTRTKVRLMERQLAAMEGYSHALQQRMADILIDHPSVAHLFQQSSADDFNENVN